MTDEIAILMILMFSVEKVYCERGKSHYLITAEKFHCEKTFLRIFFSLLLRTSANYLLKLRKKKQTNLFFSSKECRKILRHKTKKGEKKFSGKRGKEKHILIP